MAKATVAAKYVLVFGVLGLAGPAWQPACADVYKYTDAQGIVHYTDQKPRTGQHYQVLLRETDAPGVDWSQVPLNLTAYRQEIRSACRKYGVGAALVRAVIHAESWFQPHALSSKGAQGLMQLMPATQKRFGVSNAFDAGENISAGVRYLAELLKAFDGDAELAAAAYNAGPGAVTRYGGIPPYPETQTYVHRIEILHQRYLRAL